MICRFFDFECLIDREAARQFNEDRGGAGSFRACEASNQPSCQRSFCKCANQDEAFNSQMLAIHKPIIFAFVLVSDTTLLVEHSQLCVGEKDAGKTKRTSIVT